jgi:CheY-like chemotaxis protein
MMLSSSAYHQEAARCRQLGVSGYLAKPIQPADLRNAICRALSGSPSASGAVRAGPARTAAARRSLRVLVAEDNVVNQRVIVALLNRRGHITTLATNGAEAVAAWERDVFEVILMDVQMPEIGGFEATAAIRERERGTTRKARIVALTAHAMNGDRERCMAAGMDGYLTKPIDPALLYSIVETDPLPIDAAAGDDGPCEPWAPVPDTKPTARGLCG